MKLTVKETAIHTALAASDRPMTLATVAVAAATTEGSARMTLMNLAKKGVVASDSGFYTLVAAPTPEATPDMTAPAGWDVVEGGTIEGEGIEGAVSTEADPVLEAALADMTPDSDADLVDFPVETPDFAETPMTASAEEIAEMDRQARIEALERSWATDAPAMTVAERDSWATAIFLELGIAATPGYELQDEGMVLARIEADQTWVIKDITPEDPADCPACGTAGDPAATHPRLEGCLVCTHCGVVFNEFTGEKVEEAPVAEPTAKKKRAILNPQPKIDAKVAAAAKAGFALDYDKNSRLWWGAPEEWTDEPLVTMNSRDFAAYGPADLVDFLLATYASAEGEEEAAPEGEGEAAPVETPADEAAE